MDKIKGGLADGKSINDIVAHHGKKTSEKEIKAQLEKGIKVEMEHTSDKKVAREVAMDHLWEDPKYYDKLEKVEETIIPFKKLIKEEVVSTVVDESPDTIQVLAKYNGRNAGIIYVTPANAKNTLEIIKIEFKDEYQTLFIINQAIKSLWQVFNTYNSLIVAPEPEGIESWNKLGFQRVSKNYLILNRGH